MLEKLSQMPEPDRAIAERLDAIITASVPDMSPRTWYGMPAYAKGWQRCVLLPELTQVQDQVRRRLASATRPTLTTARCGRPPRCRRGKVNVALAVGFEQMPRGALASNTSDRKATTTRLDEAVKSIQGWDSNVMQAALYFGGAGNRCMKKYGGLADLFGKVSVKARSHAGPQSIRVVHRAVCDARAGDGVSAHLRAADAADVLPADLRFRGDRDRFRSLCPKAGPEESDPDRPGLATDGSSSFNDGSMIEAVGSDLARNAARAAFEQAAQPCREV